MKDRGMRTLTLLAALGFLAGIARAADPVTVFPGPAQDLAAGLAPVEYRATPLKDSAYGEGWFYLARLDDGTFLFCNFFLTNIGFGGMKASVDVTLNFPDGTKLIDRGEFATDGLVVAKNSFQVKIGDSETKGVFPDFTIRLRLPKVTADLNYHAELPSWMPGSGFVYYGEGQKKFYKYRDVIPRARVTGTLKAAGRDLKVTGYGYSDHGLTNMYPHQYAAVWYSLRSFDPHWTVQYLEFDAPDKYGKKRVPVLLIGKDGKILYAGTNYTLAREDVVKDSSGYSYPKKLTFAVDEPGFKARGTVKVASLIDSIDLLAQLKPFERFVAKMFAKSFIFRQRDQVEITITTPAGTETATLPGVNEVLYVR